MDAVSTAATLSAWGEWRNRFPSGEELPGLISDIAMRKGEGTLLAGGSRRALGVLGRPELSMSVKSLELPACDPRGSYGTALAYCTSNRGGCYLGAYPVSHELLRKPVPTDRFSFSGKARITVIAEDIYAAGDSLAVCRFALLGASLEEYGEMLEAVTGIEYTAGELQQTGARIHLTERFYNAANGFEVKDDRLPERFYREPGSGGNGIEIPPIDIRRFEEELQKYYRIRGLTPEGTFEDTAFLDRQP
jgi:aldehyde:ferredoxin oxidoreductase